MIWAVEFTKVAEYEESNCPELMAVNKMMFSPTKALVYSLCFPLIRIALPTLANVEY